MNEVKHRKWASAYWNNDFYLIETSSGYRASAWDPQGKQHTLPSNATMQELGEALLDALAHSRFLSLEEIPEFFDYKKVQDRYEAWVQALMVQHGYKTKRALFKNMAYCSIQVLVDEKKMEISPWRHKSLDGWVGAKTEGVEDVLLCADSSPVAVGEALLLAFSRCL